MGPTAKVTVKHAFFYVNGMSRREGGGREEGGSEEEARPSRRLYKAGQLEDRSAKLVAEDKLEELQSEFAKTEEALKKCAYLTTTVTDFVSFKRSSANLSIQKANVNILKFTVTIA
ncbi:hypothetical protein M5K25_021027 [Dendrobium thyrsiflorum]|uniref:Uncharacterized protein n=1 Tax=Dendrobium thyrsiflorum TaxID=117978 RepID=A0ABD0UBG6_DENTH